MKLLPMHARVFVFLAFAFLGTARAETDQTVPHAWETINYIDVPVPNTPGKMMSMRLMSNLSIHGLPMDPKSARLRFDLTLDLSQREGIPNVLAKPAKFHVEMYLPDGTVVPADASEADGWMGMSSGPGYSYQLIFFFPWTRNTLDEAWIKVSLPGQTYWAEVPYGYTRDPRAPLSPVEVRRGPPRLAPSMHKLPANDRIVPWTVVDYYFGKIQRGWELTASIGNPYDPQAEIGLSGGDPKAGDFRADKLRTEMTMGTDPPLGGVWGRLTNIHFPDGYPASRSDSFSFNSNPPDDDNVARGWGKAKITVEGKVWEYPVPSSLFCTQHGATEGNQSLRLRAPRDPMLE